jgi:hypothetical protein
MIEKIHTGGPLPQGGQASMLHKPNLFEIEAKLNEVIGVVNKITQKGDKTENKADRVIVELGPSEVKHILALLAENEDKLPLYDGRPGEWWIDHDKIKAKLTKQI